jgi:hypothetical protein
VSGLGAPQLRGERAKLANKISTLGKFYDLKIYFRSFVFLQQYPSLSIIF